MKKSSAFGRWKWRFKKMSFFLGERLGKCWLMIPHLFGRLQWTWKMLAQKTLNFGIPNWKSPPGPHAPKQKGPCSHSKRHLFRERYPHFRIKQDHQPTCITPFIIMANFTSHQAFPNKKTCWNRQGTSMSNSVGGTQTSSASIFNSWRLSAKACLLQPLFLRGHVCFWGSMLKVDQNFGNCIEFIANNKRYMLGIALVHVIPYVWIGIASTDKGSRSTPKGLILAKKLQVGPVLLRDQWWDLEIYLRENKSKSTCWFQSIGKIGCQIGSFPNISSIFAGKK